MRKHLCMWALAALFVVSFNCSAPVSVSTDAAGKPVEVSDQTDAFDASKPMADDDGDGYPNGPTDCAPQDPSVHPGALEVCGNGKDDDCNAVTSDVCGTPQPDVIVTPDVTPDGSTAVLVVTYPNALQRSLNAQVAKLASQLGQWWDKTVSSSTTTLNMEIAHVSQDACWLRVNTSDAANTKWLCAGNGSTATLDPDAGIAFSYLGRNYTKADALIWSAPGGTAAGCSALFKLKPECQL